MNLGLQLNYIRQRLEELYRRREIDLRKDWKFMTIWAGNNDLCISCIKGLKGLAFHADIFELHIRKIVEKVRFEIPKTVINLMAVMNLSQTYDVSQRTPHCRIQRTLIARIECPCTTLGQWARDSMDELAAEYNKRLFRIAMDYQARDIDNFAVIYDPGMGGLNLGKHENAEMYFSPLDCFHPSLLAHEMIAKSAW